jgi:hypothetical protein
VGREERATGEASAEEERNMRALTPANDVEKCIS